MTKSESILDDEVNRRKKTDWRKVKSFVLWLIPIAILVVSVAVWMRNTAAIVPVLWMVVSSFVLGMHTQGYFARG